MSKIDLGFLNRKQLNRVIRAVVESDIQWIEVQMLKSVEKISVVMVFENDRDKHRFETTKADSLVRDLKRLGGD